MSLHNQVSVFLLHSLLFFCLGGVALGLLAREKQTVMEVGLQKPTFIQVTKAFLFGLALLFCVNWLGRLFQISLPHFQKLPFLSSFVYRQNALFHSALLLTNNMSRMFWPLILLVNIPAENLFFRAWLFRTLRKRWSLWPAVLASALANGLIFYLLNHSLLYALVLIPIPLFLSLLYEKSGSFWVTLLSEEVYVLLALLISHAHTPIHHSKTALLWQEALFELFLFGIALLLILRRKRTLEKAGFALPKPPDALWTAPLMGFGLFLMSSFIGYLQNYLLFLLFPHATWVRQAGAAEQVFTELSKFWQRAGFIFIGTILAPLGEETFFRGWLYTTLKEKIGWKKAMMLSALLFALVHVYPSQIVPIFFIGLVLAYVYEKTGSIWVSMIMHGVNNLIAFLLLLFASHIHS